MPGGVPAGVATSCVTILSASRSCPSRPAAVSRRGGRLLPGHCFCRKLYWPGRPRFLPSPPSTGERGGRSEYLPEMWVSMPTNYDVIAAEYKKSKEQPWRTYIERFTLFELLGDLHGKRVLDLA